MSQSHLINRLRRAKPTLACRKPQKKPSRTRHLYSPVIPVRSFSADNRFMLEPIAGFPIDLSSPYCLDAVEQNLATYAQANPEATDAVLMICKPQSHVFNNEFLTPSEAPGEVVCFSPAGSPQL